MKKTLTILGLLILVIISAFTFEFIDDSILRSSHPKKYSEFVEKYSEIYNVPEYVIYSVIRTESSFKSDAVSKKGAIGLMQITPETFEWLCTKTGEEFNKTLLYDPDTNIKYGTYFLSMLQLEFVSWDTVFAAYNAGRTTVNKWLSDERYNNNGRLMNIPYKETENYVKKVNNAVKVYERLYYKNSENISERKCIMKEKTKGELLSEKLFLEKKNSYEIMTKSDIDDAYKYAEGYKNFLSEAKTEREAVKITQKMAEKCGFTEFEYGKKYSAGDKLYVNNRGKSIFLIVLGKESLENGVSIAVSHIDSPRIDLKQCPLYEDSGLAFFKTHYYGGIKKYQWTALPLALHGTIAKKDGSKIDIVIGEKEDDPVFYITDLLPHLAQDQMSKTASKVISGENLNILAGSVPYNDEKVSEKIKLNILSILNESYGICESDFLSSELCLVPAGKVRDAGLDRSMLCGYGHDDKVCAYPIVTSALEASKKIPSKTLITILADKEEVGSEGNTGMKSYAFFNVLSDIAENMGVNKYKMFENSKCLSADVNAAFDPNYADVYEAKNSSFVNKGIVVTKFTGARGKSSTNDASAEYVAEIRNIFDNAGIVWQTGELGKVDQGGGGTVAMYISEKNIDTVDVGVPVLSMHAPFEIISKTDLYSAHKAFLAFFKR